MPSSRATEDGPQPLACSHARELHNQIGRQLGVPNFIKGDTSNQTVVGKHNVTLTFVWRPRVDMNLDMIRVWGQNTRWPGAEEGAQGASLRVHAGARAAGRVRDAPLPPRVPPDIVVMSGCVWHLAEMQTGASTFGNYSQQLRTLRDEVSALARGVRARAAGPCGCTPCRPLPHPRP